MKKRGLLILVSNTLQGSRARLVDGKKYIGRNIFDRKSGREIMISGEK